MALNNLIGVGAEAGSGKYAGMIAAARAAGRPVPGIWHLFAFKPGVTEALSALTEAVMRGPSPLSPGLRELIAAFTSSRNHCLFWTGSHAAVAAELLAPGEGSGSVRQVLEDYRSAPIPESEKALLAFVEKVNRAASTIRPEDVAQVKAAGWSEEAVYDALNVCCLFNFYNRWNDAAGTPDLSPEGYLASGKRLAANGYG